MENLTAWQAQNTDDVTGAHLVRCQLPLWQAMTGSEGIPPSQGEDLVLVRPSLADAPTIRLNRCAIAEFGSKLVGVGPLWVLRYPCLL